MPHDELVSVAIDSLYHAVSDDSQWPQALTKLALVFDCPRISLMRTTPRMDNVLELHALNHDAGMQQQYTDYYWRLDPTLRLTRDASPGEWLDAEAVMSPRTTPSPEYLDFAVRGGLRFVAGGKVHADSIGCTLLGLQRPADHRPFGAAEARLYARLAPHVSRASLLAAELRGAELAQGLSQAALDALVWSVYVVARDARLLLANRSAERRLVAGQPFELRNGRLHCEDLDVRGCLTRAIESALRRRASAFSISADGTSWSVRVAPLATREDAALLYVASDCPPPPPPSVLTAYLGLSTAEAEVCCLLLQGRNVKQVAKARNVSVWTVRAQLREILQKARVSGQHQLIKRLLTLPQLSEDEPDPT